MCFFRRFDQSGKLFFWKETRHVFNDETWSVKQILLFDMNMACLQLENVISWKGMIDTNQ